MLRQDVDWAKKYKGKATQHRKSSQHTERKSSNEDVNESMSAVPFPLNK